MCHFCFFPWEMEGHVNKCHFSRQEELDVSHRLGRRTFCLGAVITGLSVLCFTLLSLLSNRSTKGSCSVSNVMSVTMVLLFFYKNYNILLTETVFFFHFSEGFLISLNMLVTEFCKQPITMLLYWKKYTFTHTFNLCVCVLVCVFVFRFVHTYIIHNHELMLIFNLLLTLSVAPGEKNQQNKTWVCFQRSVLELQQSSPVGAHSPCQSCVISELQHTVNFYGTSADMKHSVQPQSGACRWGQAFGVSGSKEPTLSVTFLLLQVFKPSIPRRRCSCPSERLCLCSSCSSSSTQFRLSSQYAQQVTAFSSLFNRCDRR